MKHSSNLITVGPDTLKETRKLYQRNSEELERYIDLLFDWNDKINLVSRNVSRETLREHIVHSLLPIPLQLLENHEEWIDSGTGGGLPGIPLAISLPEKKWFLNDNVRKKMGAVEDIVSSLDLSNVEVIPKSISLIDLKKGTGIVTKHAFKVKDLLRLLGDEPWKTILMWKGVEGIGKEVRRYHKSLNTTIYAFEFGQEEPFYEGKGLLKIER